MIVRLRIYRQGFHKIKPKKARRFLVWLQTVEKPQFCIRQNWGFERIVAKI